MKKFSVFIWDNNEYDFPMSCGFVPHITGYLHESDTSLPGILIFPGGGFCNVSPTEAEIVALKFCHLGFQAFVLTYTVNPLSLTPSGRQSIQDAARAIRLLRKHSADYNLIPSEIAVCGFSAGGHLCASLAVHADSLKDSNTALNSVSCRPDALILGYPVITLENQPYQHDFCERLGVSSQEELLYWCPEKHVSKSTPPSFIWHTATDSLISVRNSLLFADACQNNGVPYSLHIFSSGEHGMSTADEDWSAGHLGDPYATLSQLTALLSAARKDPSLLSEEQTSTLVQRIQENTTFPNPWIGAPNPEVAVWPQLAAEFLKQQEN